jgi:TPR repeat protein
MKECADATTQLHIATVRKTFSLWVIALTAALTLSGPAYAQSLAANVLAPPAPMGRSETLEELSSSTISNRDDAKKSLSLLTASSSDPSADVSVNDRELIDHNLAIAQYIVGRLYLEDRNFDLAFRWLRSAALRRHKLAAVSLSRLYSTGSGVVRNEAFAEFWSNFGARHRKDDVPGVNAP